MTSGNHDVVNLFLRSPQMTGQTSGGPFGQVPGIVHAQIKRLFVSPVLKRMRTQPPHRRTVATFTTHAIVDGLKGLRALIRPHI